MENQKENNLCIICNRRPIVHKKRQMCNLCYQRWRRKNGPVYSDLGNLSRGVLKRYEAKREIDFIKIFFNHKNWIHQPCQFHLNGANYCPDFYDGERNVFIEVAGTRQAFHENKDKYELFRQIYPKLNFEIRRSDGHLVETDKNGRFIWEYPT